VGNGFVLQVTKCEINKFTVTAQPLLRTYAVQCAGLLIRLSASLVQRAVLANPHINTIITTVTLGNALTNIATN